MKWVLIIIYIVSLDLSEAMHPQKAEIHYFETEQLCENSDEYAEINNTPNLYRCLELLEQ